MQRGGIEADPTQCYSKKKDTCLDFDAKEFWKSWPTWYNKTRAEALRKGIDEYYRSFSKQAFVQTLKRMIKGGAHVCERFRSWAQAIDKGGNGVR